MKYLLAAGLVFVASGAAWAQPKDYRSLIVVRADESGRFATSIKATEIKETRALSPGAQTVLAFWIEARKPETGSVQVYIVGERLRWILPNEAPTRGEFGPSDPPDPVYVGSPWRDADIRYRGSQIECVQSQFWCSRVWEIEIALPDEVVRSVVSNPKKKDIPLALSKPRKVQWRVPREELIATLHALGVLAEFSDKAAP